MIQCCYPIFSNSKRIFSIEGTAYFGPQLNQLHKYYNSLNNGQYWIVELNNKIVGGIGITPFDKKQKICELQKLYLAPDA
ncbi:GNAT family N-acetyltransferase [Leuconostoc suionicum]|uniref:GNAT family N-acetyltransferase n=1 Tax=Leuconostoc suionicum TaxID=1511761 RepID=UPI003144F2AA